MVEIPFAPTSPYPDLPGFDAGDLGPSFATPAHLLGDGGPPPARFMGSPCGGSFAIRPFGPDGDFVDGIAIQSGNDVQAILPSKATAGGTFTLAFAGQATAPIAFAAHDPSPVATYLDIPCTPGVAIDLSLAAGQSQGFLSHSVLCEVIEGGLVTATAIFDQDDLQANGDFHLPNTAGGGVVDAYFKKVFPGFVPTGSSFDLRMSAAAIWATDALHLMPAGGNPLVDGTIHDDADGANYSSTGSFESSEGGWSQYFDGSHHLFPGGSVGSSYTIDPADARAKLEALSTIGAGNVSVTTGARGGLAVEFIGTLGAAAQPRITSANPAVSVQQTVGGFVPTIHVAHQDGSTTDIACRQLWEPSNNPTISWALYVFDGAHAGFAFAPTDAITVAIPAGWMTSAAGPLPAGTYAVENRFGGTMIAPFVSGPKTMGIGQGVQPDPYFAECPTFINFAVRSGLDHMGPATFKPTLQWDANGYPTLLATDSAFTIVTQPPNGVVDGVGGIGPLNAPNGAWTFKWDGPAEQATGIGVGQNTTKSELTQYRDLTGTVDNVLVYNIQANQSVQAAPWINWSWVASGPADGDGHFPCSTTNLRIYPPDPSDPTGMTPWLNPTGTFMPSYLAKLKSCRVIRSMQAQNVVYNPYANFNQIKQASWLDRSGPAITRRVNVTSIRQYAGDPLNNPHTLVLQFTTDEPHEFFDGALINMEGCGTALLSQPVIINGTLKDTLNLSNPGDLGTGLVNVIDDHNFALHAIGTQSAPNTNVGGVTMTNVLTPALGSACVNSQIGTSFPIEDTVLLVNDLDAAYPGIPRSIWYNAAVTATDACIDSIAAFLAAHVNPGITVRVEAGNENWNFLYQSYVWCRIRNFQVFSKTDDSWEEAHAKIQLNVNARCQAAFDAATRSSDFIHVMPTQSSSSGPTTNILNYASSQGGRVDEVAIAPYVTNYPGTSPARANNWTTGQCLDMLELFTEDHGFSYTAANRAAIDVHYPGARIVTYEGGPQGVIPGYSDGVPSPAYTHFFPQKNAIYRHPRFHGINQALHQSYQDNGISLFTRFFAFGGGSYQVWSTYEWHDQQPGTGHVAGRDGPDDPGENPDPTNTSALTSGGLVPVVSQDGGAIEDWLALVDSTAPGLAAGTATAGSTTGTTAAATATEATGGTAPYAHQWFRSTILGQAGSPVGGQTTLSLSDAGLAPGTTYYYSLRYTDSAAPTPAAATSNQVSLTTASAPPAAATSFARVDRLLPGIRPR